MSIKEAITRILSAIKSLQDRDYIVDQGTDGIWTYRKWNSGIAECWGYTATASIACTSQWGNGYYSALQTVNFPYMLFNASPRSVQLQIWDNGGGYYATLKGWNKDNAQYYIFSPKSETRNCDTNFYVAGRWK